MVWLKIRVMVKESKYLLSKLLRRYEPRKNRYLKFFCFLKYRIFIVSGLLSSRILYSSTFIVNDSSHIETFQSYGRSNLFFCIIRKIARLLGLHFFQNYLFRNLGQNAYFTTEISQFNGKLVGCKFWRLCTVFSLLFFVEWCVLHLCITVLASHSAQWYRIVTLLKFIEICSYTHLLVIFQIFHLR